ncbi:cytochrome c-type biogenesis protein [Silanimonas sp.]|uniref:cytochrome c-type biogenesis protein n=1 Tax=Silanimonas sp. TaxID=1929290 RepID=UPI0025D8543A|nr:cytochrome c-type biogenesis protein [Silanimonas sp.]
MNTVMLRRSRGMLVLALLAFAGLASAIMPKEFHSTEEAERYRALSHEIRCVMCQNQSLADSPAGIADDLRYELLARMREGYSDEQIRDWFAARYGDFVLYRPRFNPTTWALWIGPFVVLAAGIWGLVAVIRRQRPLPTVRPEPEDR